MRRKQKWLCLAVAGLLVLALLAGCGEDNSTTDEAVGQEQQAATEQQPTESTEPTEPI